MKEYANDTRQGILLDILFYHLVPPSGSAGTLEGEVVRAACKIGYRWYNDGDKFFEGYGCETAGPAMAFLTECRELPESFREEMKGVEREALSGYSGDHYESFLKALFGTVCDFVISRQPEGWDVEVNIEEHASDNPEPPNTTPTQEDYLDYSSRYEEEDDEYCSYCGSDCEC